MTNKEQHRSDRNLISRICGRAATAALGLLMVLVPGMVAPSAQAQTFTTLHNFNGTDGNGPEAGLVQAINGSLYGTTQAGGANNNAACAPFFTGCGAVYKITPSGTLTTVYSFCAQSNCTDGDWPNGLVQATNGDFFGTTYLGGVNCSGNGGCGTVFKITPSGTLTTLYSFCAQTNCTDGDLPGGNGGDELVQGTDGDFYGTTGYGGGNGTGTGTVFKITPSGTVTTLYSFCAQTNCTDGNGPLAGLVQATNGDFYGTTAGGGANNYGTVFKITSSGALTTLHSFDGTDGGFPEAGLVQSTDGKFYGTTSGGGGASGYGSVFRLSVGLGPFVESLPASGKVGAAVKILGSKLARATSVTFNGTAAVFTVVSSTQITTTVPAGAATGRIKVVTPGGTLSSNVPFRVRP
jgi:uncharacterized repeat protein (TIGR03803 family)